MSFHILALVGVVLSSSLAHQQTSVDSLDAKFKAKGKKYFGTCADKSTLGKPKNSAVISKEFGQVTPENRYEQTGTGSEIIRNANRVRSMKWDSTERSPGKFGYEGADFLVHWAQNNSKFVRGHTFLWHSQLPGDSFPHTHYRQANAHLQPGYQRSIT